MPRVPASHQKHLLEGKKKKKKIQEQLKRNVSLMALNKKKKKKTRLGKDFCLLIGPVAVATR